MDNVLKLIVAQLVKYFESHPDAIETLVSALFEAVIKQIREARTSA